MAWEHGYLDLVYLLIRITKGELAGLEFDDAGLVYRYSAICRPWKIASAGYETLK